MFDSVPRDTLTLPVATAGGRRVPKSQKNLHVSNGRPTTLPNIGWESSKAMHEHYVEVFEDTPGAGYFSRMAPTRHFYERVTFFSDDQLYSVDKIDMISFADETRTVSAAQPVAFINPTGHPLQGEQLKSVVKRPLTVSENDAVKLLMTGQETAVFGDKEHPTLLGALRANNGCLRCHDGKAGDLRGAFIYPMKAVEASRDVAAR